MSTQAGLLHEAVFAEAKLRQLRFAGGPESFAQLHSSTRSWQDRKRLDRVMHFGSVTKSGGYNVLRGHPGKNPTARGASLQLVFGL